MARQCCSPGLIERVALPGKGIALTFVTGGANVPLNVPFIIPAGKRFLIHATVALATFLDVTGNTIVAIPYSTINAASHPLSDLAAIPTVCADTIYSITFLSGVANNRFTIWILD